MGQMMAMSLVALLPVLVIFATCQKYFIQGIKMSGLKDKKVKIYLRRGQQNV